MVDGVGLQFHLADGEVPLKIGAVIHGVPQAEFHIGEKRYGALYSALVGDGQTDQQAVVTLGYQHLLTDGHAVFDAADDGVAQPVAAFVIIS